VAASVTSLLAAGCGGGAAAGTAAADRAPAGQALAAGPTVTVTVTPAADAPAPSATGVTTKKPARTTKTSGRPAPRSTRPAPAASAPSGSGSAQPVGACTARTKPASRASGRAPVQYTKGWTPAPVAGCRVKDKQGRQVVLTAAQNRMLYRVNEMRRLQNARDRGGRPVLQADFCLMELAQDFARSNPGGHNPLLMKMYPIGRTGAGTGSNWINENYGMHGGYTSDPMAAVDRLVYGWFTSGSLTTGHYGNMMDRTWTRAGMGVVVKGSSALGIQNFSHNPAMYSYPKGKSCSQPPKPRHGDSTVPPIGPPPGF
jgi:uncharacterized protein YkwD